MANTIATAIGVDSNRQKIVHRLGSRYSTGRADTWRTFATVTTFADGSGMATVVRDGKTIINVNWGAE